MKKPSNTHNRFIISKKILLYGVSACLVSFLAIYVWACWNIGSGVDKITAQATKEYPGDRVEALIAYMQSEKHCLKDRNMAIWALGQIGDGRALPVLEKLYTGGPCEHDKYVCQRELKKAIDLCKGGLNICSRVSR
jgi:hypothetical protein